MKTLFSLLLCFLAARSFGQTFGQTAAFRGASVPVVSSGSSAMPNIAGIYAVLIADWNHGSVTNWVSTNGQTLSWASPSTGNNPTYLSSLQNGRAAYSFDGAASVLILTNTFPSISSFTLFAVMQSTVTNSGAYRVWFSESNASGSQGMRLRVEPSGALGDDYPNVDFQMFTVPWATNKLQLLTVRIGSSWTSNRLNGVSIGSFNSVPNVVTTPFCSIGADTDSNHLWFGNMAAIILCTNAASSADILSMESWLTTYYNIQ
jgi:hypothetical protein